MRSIPCATAGSRGCSTSDARRCLRGSSPSFRGPNGEGFCASQSRSAFRTRATVKTGVRQRSICGRWARSRRRSPGERSSSMYLHTNRYTTRSAGLCPRSTRAETRNGSSAGSETDVGGNRPRGGACPRRPCGTANGSVRGVVLTCVAALGARSSDSVTGSLIDAGRQSPGVISGAVQQSLSWRGLTCLPRAARESARAISSQPAAHHPDGPDRSHPEAYLLRSTPRGGSKRRKQSIRCGRPTRWDQKGPARASRPSGHRRFAIRRTVSTRWWKVSAWRGENEKGLGKAGSEIVGRRIPVAVLAFRTLAFFAFDRLLDDALLDDRCGRVGWSGRRHRPAGLNSSRRSACDDRSTARWALIAHQGSALVADRGRHGVEGAARRARLRAHLAHLLFLAEPVFEGEEGRLLAPPFLELGFAQAAAQLSGGFLLEASDDLVVLEAHLLLVVRHLELARRELDAALRALFHVDRDPGLAVRALRHVPLELDAALRARRRVLRDEGAALA